MDGNISVYDLRNLPWGNRGGGWGKFPHKGFLLRDFFFSVGICVTLSKSKIFPYCIYCSVWLREAQSFDQILFFFFFRFFSRHFRNALFLGFQDICLQVSVSWLFTVFWSWGPERWSIRKTNTERVVWARSCARLGKERAARRASALRNSVQWQLHLWPKAILVLRKAG